LDLDVMRVGFAGTPEFSKLALHAILNAGYEVPLVLTQPDRPSGRGLKLTPSAVKQLALEHDIPVLQPRSLRLDGKYPEDAQTAQVALQQAQLDVLVVAAYGLILPAWVLQTPRYGCLNIHASLLPRWRGAAPIQRAIEAGDTQTGITIMQMDEGLDTGPMLLVEALDIEAHDNAANLHDKLADRGARLIVQALCAVSTGSLIATQQPVAGVTYAAKLDKAEAALDLRAPAELLARRIRAFNPAPGATVKLPGIAEPVKIWNAVALPSQKAVTPSGNDGVAHVLSAGAEGIDISTGQGTLRLLELQRPGGKRQPASIFMTSWSAVSR
jgi:methionyl-tRNA formyltransferase